MHFVVGIVQRVRAININEVKFCIRWVDSELGQKCFERDIVCRCIG